MTDLAPDLPVTGELLDGRYLLERRIGAGGMGVVYRARDEALGRTVAIKLFRPGAADATDTAHADRVRSETRLLAALNHPSLVTLFDARIDPVAPSYLVMELIEGPTLRERLTQGPLSPADAVTLTGDLAAGLHAAHTAGVVHRDVKPSNVLLRPSVLPGEPFRATLADFGIAYLIDSTRVTTPGTLVGTAAYLSPEQVRGAEPAPASDVYALGLVLIEALTGERAYPQSGTAESALARLHHDPVVPRAFGYEWRSLLTAMTARDPDARPTALDVIVAARTLSTAAPESLTATAALPPTAAVPVVAASGPLAAGEPTGVAAAAVAAPSSSNTGPTVVMPAGAGAPAGPVGSPTAATVALPAGAGAPAEPAIIGQGAAPGETPRRASRRQQAERRRRLTGLLVAGAATVVLGASLVAWSAAQGQASTPSEQQVQPAVSSTPEPVATDAAEPVADTGAETATDTTTGTGAEPVAPVGTGTEGNPNQGPGNNNGDNGKADKPEKPDKGPGNGNNKNK